MLLLLINFTNGLTAGIEFSELLQNRFRDIGINNLTFFVETKLKNPKNHISDVKFVFINVELSNEHLSSETPFIHGNTENLTGNLTVFRLYSLYSTGQRHSGFLNLSATTGMGIGYEKTVLKKNNDLLMRRGVTGGITLLINWLLWDKLIIEFPVCDISLFLWKTGSLNGNLDGAVISFPSFGSVYFWINMGIRFAI